MKSVILTRGYQNSKGTLGLIDIIDEDHPPIFTAERPWRDNAANVSCIPRGTYICHPFAGQKYKNVYEVRDVPNRSYILFHTGNSPMKDSKGCILIGLTGSAKEGEPVVYSSKAAMEKFKEIIGLEPFKLSIY